jgi:hypothetical protein
LLKETLHRIETTGSTLKANVVAGFCATGIVPLNREKVLKKLPDYGPNLNDSQDAWNKSFETILENVRFPDKGKGRTNITCGGKRIQVAPGKSVCIEPELDTDMDTETEDLVSEDSSEWSPEVEEGGGSPNSGEESASNIEKTKNAGSSLKELQNGDFILAKFFTTGTKKQERQFVGQIQCTGIMSSSSMQDPSKIVVEASFLRNYNNHKDIFVFPNVPDVCQIEGAQILRVLKKTYENRGRFKFENLIV